MKEYENPDFQRICFENCEIITLSASGFYVLPDGEVSVIFKDSNFK